MRQFILKIAIVLLYHLGGRRGYICIKIIDIESKEVMTTIPMDTTIYGMAIRGRTIY